VEAPGKAVGLFLSWIENWIVVADLDLGHADRAVQRAREVVMWERKLNRRHITCAFALSNLARGLVRQGSLDEARAVLEELFDCCRVSAWHGFGIFSDLCTLLALREGRLSAAACLIGFADEAWERIGRPPGASVRFRAKAIASLKADMDGITLEGLIELGAQMDEESVCALTLGGSV
jgi:hypothetical protein